MNKILELLGSKYEMRVRFDKYSGSCGKYIVRVSNGKENSQVSFPAIEAETAQHDVLLCAVEQCIFNFEIENVIDNNNYKETVLSPYVEYVKAYAKNHGISFEAAANQPMCKARLEVFNKTGK